MLSYLKFYLIISFYFRQRCIIYVERSNETKMSLGRQYTESGVRGLGLQGTRTRKAIHKEWMSRLLNLGALSE